MGRANEEDVMASVWTALLAAAVFASTAVHADEAKEKPAGGNVTRVMSFNIRYGTAKDGEDRWENRRDALVKVIRSYDPDLFGTQEVLAEQQDFLQEQFPEYGFVGAGRDDGKRKGEASPVAYRKDRYDLQASGMIWLSPTPEKVGSKGWDAALPRVATWVILKDKKDGGRELFYVNTHWDHVGNQARVEAAKVMRQLIDDKRGERPVIVTGDFNSTEDLPQYRTLTGADGPEKSRLIDAYRHVHPTPAAEEASFNGFKGTREGKRIDWILHSPDYTATAATIDYTKTPAGRYPSDHYPVTAELKRSGS
jgi:endonuclease/exonuclease/phosphatase family metal-dependent hydrolase